jgi:N utilization substance protein B
MTDVGSVSRAHFAHFVEERTEDDVREFAERLLQGTLKRLAEIDALIETGSRNWRLERMAVVDRSVLRLAVFELIDGEVPKEVVMNEALELGKEFGSEESASFINGVLAGVSAAL